MIGALIHFLIVILILFIVWQIVKYALSLFGVPFNGPIIQIVGLIFLLIVLIEVLGVLGLMDPVFPLRHF